MVDESTATVIFCGLVILVILALVGSVFGLSRLFSIERTGQTDLFRFILGGRLSIPQRLFALLVGSLLGGFTVLVAWATDGDVYYVIGGLALMFIAAAIVPHAMRRQVYLLAYGKLAECEDTLDERFARKLGVDVLLLRQAGDKTARRQWLMEQGISEERINKVVWEVYHEMASDAVAKGVVSREEADRYLDKKGFGRHS